VILKLMVHIVPYSLSNTSHFSVVKSIT